MTEDAFVESLLALGGWLTRSGSRLMAPLGLSQQESVILIAVVEQGPIPQRDLRSDLMLERSNVSKAVLHLESKGLLTTGPSPADARVTLARATPEGRALAGRCLQTYRRWNRDWLEGSDPQLLAVAASLLQDLRRRSPGATP